MFSNAYRPAPLGGRRFWSRVEAPLSAPVPLASLLYPFLTPGPYSIIDDSIDLNTGGFARLAELSGENRLFELHDKCLPTSVPARDTVTVHG